jgi:hypothetical protein
MMTEQEPVAEKENQSTAAQEQASSEAETVPETEEASEEAPLQEESEDSTEFAEQDNLLEVIQQRDDTPEEVTEEQKTDAPQPEESLPEQEPEGAAEEDQATDSGAIEETPELTQAEEGEACVVEKTDGCYNTIQEAVDAATPGNTIELSDGTFTEDVVISKSLTILGSAATIWNGATTSSRNSTPVVSISGPSENMNVTISGISFNSQKQQIIYADWPIDSAYELGLNISDNTFSHVSTPIDFDSAVFGVYVNGAHQKDRDGSGNGAIQINNNNFSGVHGAILMENSKSFDVNNNQVQAFYEGFVYNYYDNDYDLGDHQTIGNTIIVDGVLGINNWHSNSGNYTVLPSVIDNNEISGSDLSYSILYNDSSNSAQNFLTVQNNSFLNGNFLRWGSNVDNYEINAIENYWGNDSGPSGEGSGSGTSVSAGVDYCPWNDEDGELAGDCYIEPPQMLGWNEDNGSGDDFATPRPEMEIACGGTTSINGASNHWTDVSEGNEQIKYQRQFQRPNQLGTENWSGNEIFSTPYSNFRQFGGNPGQEGTYNSRVRAFIDENDNNTFDEGETTSEWSDTCQITYDISVDNSIVVYDSSLSCAEGETMEPVADMQNMEVNVGAGLSSAPDKSSYTLDPVAVSLPPQSEDKKYVIKAHGQYAYDGEVKRADAAYATGDNWSGIRSDIGIEGGYQGVTSLMSDMGTDTMGVVMWQNESNTVGYSEDHEYYYGISVPADTAKTIKFTVNEFYGSWYTAAPDNNNYNTWNNVNDEQNPLAVSVYECVSAEEPVTPPCGENLVENGEFSDGATGFASSYGNTDITLGANYKVTTNPQSVHGRFVDLSGNDDPMLVINGGQDPADAAWQQTMTDLRQNTDYRFMMNARSVTSSNPANVYVRINGEIVSTTQLTADVNAVAEISFTWNSESNTEANIEIGSTTTDWGGNDFAIDGIVFADDECENNPVNSDITVCKEDAQGNRLSGWEMNLGGQLLAERTFTDEEVQSDQGFQIGELPAGDYRIEVSGTYQYGNSQMIADAGYSYRPNNISEGCDCWFNNDFTTYTPGTLEVQIDGQVIEWGDYNDSHLYETVYTLDNSGQLRFNITDNSYGDNRTSTQDNPLTVRVYSIEQSQVTEEDQDGCTTFESVPFGEYTLTETIQEGWQVVQNPTNGGLITVEEEGETTYTFVNEREEEPEPETGTLKISKYICEDSEHLVDPSNNPSSGTESFRIGEESYNENELRSMIGDFSNNNCEPADAETSYEFQVTYNEANSSGGGWNPAIDVKDPLPVPVTEGSIISETDEYSIVETGVNGTVVVEDTPIMGRYEIYEIDEDDNLVAFACHRSSGFGNVINNGEFATISEPGATAECIVINKPEQTLDIPFEPVADIQACKEDETGTPVEDWTIGLSQNEVEKEEVFSGDILVLSSEEGYEGVRFEDIDPEGVYEVVVEGTWTNRYGKENVDAAYVFQSRANIEDEWEDTVYQYGFDYEEYGSDVTDRDTRLIKVTIDDQYINWGEGVDDYNPDHTYSVTMTGENLDVGADGIEIGIFDYPFTGGTPDYGNDGWYEGNNNPGEEGSSFTVTIYRVPQIEDYADQSLETELDQQGTQACVTFADVPYGEYTLSEETRAEEGWTVQTEPGNEGVNTGEDSTDGVVTITVADTTNDEIYTFVNQRPEEEPQTPPEEETPNEEQPPEEQPPDEPEGEAVLEHSTYIEEESPVETVANGTRYMSTSTITNTGTSVLTNVTAITAPIEGAEYVLGSWTGTETEPTFSSPGTWTIGTLQPGESRTISYTASIDDNQEQGLYKDLVWAKGTDENGTEILSEGVASRYVNASFVGDEIRITADAANVERERINIEQERTEEVTEEGEVLGASTGLPATGAKTVWVILASILTMLGGSLVIAGMMLRKTQKKTPRLHPITKSFPSGSLMRSLGVLLAFAFITGFLITGKTFAADLDIRLEDQTSPTGQDNFKLSFTTLDILGRDVQVKCYKKAPTETDFVQFDGTKSLPGGGGSGACSVDQSIVNQQGTYQFYTIAQAGADEQTSEVISVDYDTEAGPGTPVSYDKSKSGCTYTISFKTADDEGETARVELYRSEDTDFPIDAGTRVASTDIGSNDTAEFEDTPGDCGKEYYYAIRAFDTAGNASGVVGDTIINVTTITTTTTDGGTTDNATTEQADTGTGDTGGAIPVDNANIPPEQGGAEDALVADEEGDVQGAQDDDAEEDDGTDQEENEDEETENETTEEDNGTADGTEEDGDVLGETDETGGNSNAMVYVSIFGATVIFGVLAYFFLIRNKAKF